MNSDKKYKNQIATEEENGLLVDPEPFSVFLGIMGFIGSVASIAGYIEFKREQRRQITESRVKLLREAKDLLMALEVDTMQTEASLRKLEFILAEGTSEYHSMPLSNLKLEFGSCKPVFTLHGFNKFDEVITELNHLVGRSFETTSKLLQKLYNVDITIEEKVYLQLIELQNRLNKILRESLTYDEGFRTYYEIIAFTKDILRRMRIHVMKAI
jgi:hypothetical protein